MGTAFPTSPPGSTPLPRSDASAAPVGRLLAAAAVAVVLTHWLRLLPLGFAAPGATRYEDFVDLLTPFVVAGPALLALARVGVDRCAWVLAGLGTAVFVQGHALHLAANSIVYARGPAAPADLWDEVVGHALWFVGLSLLTAVVTTTAGAHVGQAGRGAQALALLVGLTWAANLVEGGMVPLGSALAVALVVVGARTGRAAGRLLVTAFASSLLLVAGYGVWRGGFPQPSELGWL